jgi:hypothetical protein
MPTSVGKRRRREGGRNQAATDFWRWDGAIEARVVGIKLGEAAHHIACGGGSEGFDSDALDKEEVALLLTVLLWPSSGWRRRLQPHRHQGKESH